MRPGAGTMQIWPHSAMPTTTSALGGSTRPFGWKTPHLEDFPRTASHRSETFHPRNLLSPIKLRDRIEPDRHSARRVQWGISDAARRMPNAVAKWG